MECDRDDFMFMEVFATDRFVFPTNIMLVAVSSVGAGCRVTSSTMQLFPMSRIRTFDSLALPPDAAFNRS